MKRGLESIEGALTGKLYEVNGYIREILPSPFLIIRYSLHQLFG